MSRPTARRTAIVAALLLTAGATPAPTTAPAAGVPDPHVVRWLDGLADADPAVRAKSRALLAGLPRDGLVWLLAAVRSAPSIGPSQAAELREVVAQIFLTAEPYTAAVWGPDDVFHLPDRPLTLGLGWPDGAAALGSPAGLAVADRWPGFPAGRWLQRGDVIVGISPVPAMGVRQEPLREVRSSDDLNAALADARAGTGEVELFVRRNGSMACLLMTAAPLPAEIFAGPARVNAFFAERQHRADAYWGATFAAALARPGPSGGTGGRP